MWPRSLRRFGGVLIGIVVGSGVASLLVAWTNEGFYISTPTPRIRSGKENIGLEQETDESNSQNNLYKAYSHVHTIVFFIGYPRSRHSLLGSLLDAHPHMVVSDESMAFPRWKGILKRRQKVSVHQFYDTIFRDSERAVIKGRRSRVLKGSVVNRTSEYGYRVPHQLQGTYDHHIEVIGDKSGAFTARAMRDDDALDAVHVLEQASGAEVKFIHVVRNPSDNIAAMTLQEDGIKKRDGTHETKVDAPAIVDRSIQRYFSWAEGSNKAREALPGQVIDIPSIEIVKNPVETLRKICVFLETTCTEKYLRDCAATVDAVPSITRDFIIWTTEQKTRVYEQMKKYSFLSGYSYEQ